MPQYRKGMNRMEEERANAPTERTHNTILIVDDDEMNRAILENIFAAHYQVEDDGTIGQLVWDSNTAWHASNWDANCRSIGVEHANEPDGTITEINDRPLIERALRDRVAPLMVLTNIKEGGRFDSDIAHDILQSTAVQDLILDAVVLEMDEKNYYGLDVDFEYIYPEDRDAYVAFLRKAADKVRPLGYSLSVALAPKLSATQKGILYEAHDYAQIGAIVDRVILMTYEWGYTYGPAQV